MTILFKTPGQLDIRAITTFGVNAKPKTVSPIGYFGTGLKYAVAVLVRENCPLTIFIGSKKYTFYKIKDTFRDKQFDFIVMREHSFGFSTNYKLPFTTELGKNWKLWQAFRELYSNTIDEDGVVETYYGELSARRDKHYTQIMVDGEAFLTEYNERDKNFLPDGLRTEGKYGDVQVICRPSEHIYYRGMRVMDLREPSVVTYNITGSLELTEDRTAKDRFYVDWFIKNAIAKNDNVKVLHEILSAGEKTYESTINFKDITAAPSDIFTYVVKALKDDKQRYNYSALSYARSHEPDFLERQAEKPVAQRIYEKMEEHEYDQVRDIIRNNQQYVKSVLTEYCRLHHNIQLETKGEKNGQSTEELAEIRDERLGEEALGFDAVDQGEELYGTPYG